MNQDRKQKILTVAAEAVSEWEQKLAATDWKVEKDSHGINIAKSKIFTDKKRPLCWKVEFTVEEDIERVMKLFKDPQIRKKWDKNTKDFKILETISDEVFVTHAITNSVGVISARDFIDARSFQVKKNNETITQFRMVGTSIDLEKYTPEKKVVRGMSYSSGIQLDKAEVDGKSITRVIFLNQVDINGWIPEAAINAAMTSNMYSMAQTVQKHAKDDDLFSE
jgi:L-rhamnose mutarotase